MKKFRSLLESPTFLRKFSGWEAVFWLIASVPIVIWFSDSVPVVVWLSVYAILRTSLSNWQSSRMEAAQAALQKQQTEEIVDKVDKVTPAP